jgi:hypothetical protein
MKRIIKLGALGTLLALGGSQIEAATTNYWVQNVNVALTGYTQVKGQIIHGSLSTKQFLAFLSGVTNPALVSSQIVVPVTNSVYTNLTVEATDYWLLPTNVALPGDLPRSYTVTTDYVLTNDNGITRYTNNINFTNDIFVTRTSDTNVTYTFNNAVIVSTVPTNRTAYLFPRLPADSLTAVWTNHGPGTVFVLSGWVVTNVVGTKTNYLYARNPDFTKLPGTKLLYITPVVDGTNFPSKYVVRYKAGGKNVDTDISSFLSDGRQYLSVFESLGVLAQTRIYAFTEIDFDNQAGTSFNFIGFDTQTWGAPPGKGSALSNPVLKNRKMAVGNFGGAITGQVQARKFTYATTVVKGTISISGGKLE